MFSDSFTIRWGMPTQFHKPENDYIYVVQACLNLAKMASIDVFLSFPRFLLLGTAQKLLDTGPGPGPKNTLYRNRIYGVYIVAMLYLVYVYCCVYCMYFSLDQYMRLCEASSKTKHAASLPR